MEELDSWRIQRRTARRRREEVDVGAFDFTPEELEDEVEGESFEPELAAMHVETQPLPR
jgi:hypothetical protein